MEFLLISYETALGIEEIAVLFQFVPELSPISTHGLICARRENR